jgi:hypothetical protein
MFKNVISESLQNRPEHLSLEIIFRLVYTGKNCAQLAVFKNEKYFFFCSVKPTSLAQFFAIV